MEWSLTGNCGRILVALTALFLPILRAQERPPAEPFLNMPEKAATITSWEAVPAFPQLPKLGALVKTMLNPVNGEMLVVDRTGAIYSFPNEPNAVLSATFLDIRPRTLAGGDIGLLDVVFHPEFGVPTSTNRGYLYVWYSHHPDPANVELPPDLYVTSTNRLSRFTVPDGSQVADPNSELILIEQQDRHWFHAGAGMFFGPDGFLYISVSDEGASYDLLESAQQIDQNLFSGVLRIDVDMQGGDISHPIPRQPLRGRTAHYYIPKDNPWVGQENVLEEFYAVGLRNPYRMTYDLQTGTIWIGDVGQSGREELNWLVKGANYEWPFKEGTLVYEPPPEPFLGTLQTPVYEYDRSEGICVIGGFVYHGEKFQEALGGKYIFADVTGAIWSMAFSETAVSPPELLTKMEPPSQGQIFLISGLGPDPNGEILISTVNGTIFRLQPVTSPSSFPPILSQTGVFADVVTLQPSTSLYSYQVKSPLWSDGARKQRWMSIPFVQDAPPEMNYIGFAAHEPWRFPPGSVFVKHFEIQTNTLDPNAIRRLETRLLVQEADGGVYGVTYRWRLDGSDADIVLDGETEEIAITTPEGVRQQIWYYPGVSDCLRCHTPAAGYVLGVNTRQLNHDLPATSELSPFRLKSNNQIFRLSEAGYFTNTFTPESLVTFPSLVDPLGNEGSLHDRVRSYLDANCAHCHVPGGVRAIFDARFQTELAEQGIIQGPALDDLGLPGSLLVYPRDLTRSVLLKRMTRSDQAKMPPLARNLVDDAAVALLERWINAMPALELHEPPHGSTLHPASLQVQATTQSGEIAVDHMDFFLNGAHLTNVSGSVANFPVPNLQPGQFELSALLYDVDGGRYAVPSHSFQVDNTIPLVTILNPAAQLVPTTALSLTANAVAAPGRYIEELQIFLDSELLDSTPQDSWGTELTEVAPGMHLLLVQARDNSGAVGRGSALFRAEHLPEFLFASNPEPPPLYALLRTNLAADIMLANNDSIWRGVDSKPGPIRIGLPDPFGGTNAIHIPQANLGGPTGHTSGLFQHSDDPLLPGYYAVSVWLRSVSGEFPVFFGVSGDAASEALLTPDWKKFTTILQVEHCQCPEDFKVFQLSENLPDGGPWEIAFPEVYRISAVTLPFHALQEGGAIVRLQVVLDGALLGESSSGVPPELLFSETGAFSLVLRAENNFGLWSESAPITLLVGPRPRITWSSDPRQIVLHGYPGLPWTLQSSSDLVNWSPVQSSTMSGWNLEITGTVPSVVPSRLFYRTITGQIEGIEE